VNACMFEGRREEEEKKRGGGGGKGEVQCSVQYTLMLLYVILVMSYSA